MFLRFKNISINTDNVGFIEVRNKEFFLKFKRKASIQTIQLEVTEEVKRNPAKLLSQFNYYNIEGYFVNPNNITFIQEEVIMEGMNDTAQISIYFKDSMFIEFIIPISRWKIWKSNRLKTGY